MILVLFGTVHYPFNRLVRVVNKLAGSNDSETIMVQVGHSTGFKGGGNLSVKSFYPHKDLLRSIKEARVVVCQGGEGSVLEVLSLSQKRLVVFPRDPQFGEHVDEQQLRVGRQVQKKKLATVVFTESELLALVKSDRLKTIKADGKVNVNHVGLQRIIKRLEEFTNTL